MNEEYNKLLRPGTAIVSWISSWSRHVRSWTSKNGVVVVRYEDLKADPAQQFTRILEGLRIKLNKPRLNKAIRLCEISRLRKQEARVGFIENGLQDKFFGQGKGWQQELTGKQARRIEEDHGEVMKELGYL